MVKLVKHQHTYLLMLLTGLCSYPLSMKCIQGAYKIKMFSLLAYSMLAIYVIYNFKLK